MKRFMQAFSQVILGLFLGWLLICMLAGLSDAWFATLSLFGW